MTTQETLTPRGLAYSELVIEVFRLNGLLLSAGDELAKPSGLTSARWQVLGVIDHQPATVADVAHTMGLTRQSVRQTVEALVGAGLVSFHPNPRHRRAKLLEPTPRGRAALAEVERRQADWANRIGGHASLPELTATITMLRELGGLLGAVGQPVGRP
ncbi:MarR family winged helix-turn-helix transcriptional regulator [Saccharomonospora sp. NPDC006951]